MEVEILEGDKKEFLEQERKAIYPDLGRRAFDAWIQGMPLYQPLYIGLVTEDELIGGAVVEIQDFLTKDEILLQLDALWIKEAWRRRGLGSLLLQETFKKARSYYQRYQMNPIGILIQTTSLDEGAETFYRKFLTTHYPFKETKLKMGGGVEIICFLVSFQ